MATTENTGYKIYTILVQYNARTGEPTGVVKPNIPSDPDYVAPVLDLTSCPASAGAFDDGYSDGFLT